VTINVISRLEGGLGNQLFQYAFAKKISNDLNCELTLDNGITLFQNVNRRANLHNYKIQCKIISLDGRLCLFPKAALEKNGLTNVEIIKEDKSLDISKVATKISKNTYLIGWWQSYKHIDSIKEILKEEIYPKAPVSREFLSAKSWIESKNNTVAIHVRRGDFVNSDFGILPKSYYFDALKLLKSKVQKPEILFFSDDPEWVQSELVSKFEGQVISNKWDLKEYEELVLMSLCDHHIIANSSFSWWGCWLKKNVNGISIRPSHWFAKKNAIVNEENICPQHWLKVSVLDDFITSSNKLSVIRNLKFHFVGFLALISFKRKK
jgi:hypothetical protein